MTEYYLAINGQQSGPFSKEALKQQNITPDTLVWRSGLTEWKPCRELSELDDLFEEVVIAEQPSGVATPPPPHPLMGEWFAMFGNRREGPATIGNLINMGLNPQTPVWKQGMNDWVMASRVPEIMAELNKGSYGANSPYGTPQPTYGQSNYGQQNPNYGQPNYGQPNYGSPQPNYDQPNYGQTNPTYGQQNSNYGFQNSLQSGYQRLINRKDWLAPAIIATVLSACSCIGIIFGIIAIVQANKANTLYAAGYEQQAERANSNAKTMTLITFGFAVLSILGGIINVIFNS